MANLPSFWSFITNASLVVKIVMLLLTLASVASWTIILQRWLFLGNAREAAKNFEKQFWSGTDLSTLHAGLNRRGQELHGLENIFCAGYEEFNRLNRQTSLHPDPIMEATTRSMRIALSQELEKLEQHLAFLATVGSISPYVGLFGTVWGIMTSFRSLGVVQQATIAMVAPGISEALIATAMGLFAAIPAVIAYNHYVNIAERLANFYETFQEELTRILHRQAHLRQPMKKIGGEASL